MSDEGKSTSNKDDVSSFLRAWAWKREHRPDKVRFERPYLHRIDVSGRQVVIKVRQKPFRAEGFASTVWDSSIVVAKYLEKWPDRFAGKRVLDLSAGCGLPGIVAGLLGANVVATDLQANVDFLRTNFEENKVSSFEVQEYQWGDQVDLDRDFDYIIGCDLMYIEEAVQDLVQSLRLLASPLTEILFAYGRNRQAEQVFMKQAARYFDVADIAVEELDSVYRCNDVRFIKLRLRSEGVR